MTQPSEANSHMYDRDDNPMLDDQLAAVTAAVAITNYTSVSTTNPVTNTEGDAISAALSTLEDEVTLLQVAVNLIIERLEAHGLIADN